MKTFAPKTLRGADLRGLLADLVATPAQVAKFLAVSERSVWRWLSDGSAPRAVLYALWHETGAGREASMLDAGNLLNLTRSKVSIQAAHLALGDAQLRRLLAISDTGAANDALMRGPVLKQAALCAGLAGTRPLFLGLGGWLGLGLESP